MCKRKMTGICSWENDKMEELRKKMQVIRGNSGISKKKKKDVTENCRSNHTAQGRKENALRTIYEVDKKGKRCQRKERIKEFEGRDKNVIKEVVS